MVSVVGLIVKGKYFFKDLLFSLWHSIMSIYLNCLIFHRNAV